MMRYVVFVVLTTVFIGCGATDSSSDENPPVSPQTTKSDKTPPSVPKI